MVVSGTTSNAAWETTEARGITAYAPRGFEMPAEEHRGSAQAWNSDPDISLSYEQYAQCGTVRSERIAKRYPNG